MRARLFGYFFRSEVVLLGTDLRIQMACGHSVESLISIGGYFATIGWNHRRCARTRRSGALLHAPAG
jgi:hypothetical protein